MEYLAGYLLPKVYIPVLLVYGSLRSLNEYQDP
jgi:hypothetical protein